MHRVYRTTNRQKGNMMPEDKNMAMPEVSMKEMETKLSDDGRPMMMNGMGDGGSMTDMKKKDMSSYGG